MWLHSKLVTHAHEEGLINKESDINDYMTAHKSWGKLCWESQKKGSPFSITAHCYMPSQYTCGATH